MCTFIIIKKNKKDNPTPNKPNPTPNIHANKKTHQKLLNKTLRSHNNRTLR